MRAEQILADKGRDVATVSSTATVADATEVLSQNNCGALVVSDDGTTVAGIVSERDIVRRLADSGAETLSQPVSELMNAEVVTCDPKTDTASLMDLMTDRRIRHVPVLDGGQLAGIISIGDVVKVRVGELQTEREQLVGYIRDGR